MAHFELVMPKLGESVQEARITKMFIKEGDTIEEDAPVFEIATDKVDSEIPSPVAGVIKKIFYKEDDVVPVGKIVAIVSLGNENEPDEVIENPTAKTENTVTEKRETHSVKSKTDRFYSPLVKTIAAAENVTNQELEKLIGTGTEGRVTKKDILNYIENRKSVKETKIETKTSEPVIQHPVYKVNVSIGAEDAVIEMDRVRKLIADHMVTSKHVSPHVTAMIEVDVTNIVQWREKHKDTFLKRENIKLTYLPVFLEAIARGLKEFPMVNSSVDGYNIVLRKNVNIGVAVALPTGNLIVPVIKKADQLNLYGITKEMNRLAEAARTNKLSPDDIQNGTFSVTNFGTFRNVMGTPIINQPQTAIMAIGTVEKKPAVVETPVGDVIAIRHKMFLSLTYDHRVIDGVLGGTFLRKVGDYIETFDSNRTI